MCCLEARLHGSPPFSCPVCGLEGLKEARSHVRVECSGAVREVAVCRGCAWGGAVRRERLCAPSTRAPQGTGSRPPTNEHRATARYCAGEHQMGPH